MKHSSSYDKFPEILVRGGPYGAWAGWEAAAEELKRRCLSREQKKTVLVVDCYPGVRQEEILRGLEDLEPALILDSDSCALEPEKLDALLAETLTDDRVFGVMTAKRLEDFFLKERLEEARRRIQEVPSGIVLILGVGAALITSGDVLVCADMSRWELQLRFRAGLPNWRCRNGSEDPLKKFKRGYFAEWRWADQHKKGLLDQADYFLDTVRAGKPVLAEGNGVRAGLKQAAREPFRTVPYFDPGVWGGQWMKKVCGLDENQPNFAWSFDGVPEENSLLLRFGADCPAIELPAMNLTLYQPRPLLGERVHARFGAEFPIRFDFLDTMGGQNLSLQVHPLTEYIQERFHMHYTQDESYYILDAEPEACVYLGVKTNVDRDAMLEDLSRAQQGEKDFPADQYINRFPVKKHDHVLIPAGTIHCSGAGAMVLEVSATPYIFTFKLWDWGRLGLDGRPRPIHLEHGAANIQWERDTEWVQDQLLHQEKILEKGDGLQIERTGLHEREFLETLRFSFDKPFRLPDNGSVRMLNVVEGEQAVVSSLSGAFPPFPVHYAETFILPEAAKDCILTPDGPSLGKTVRVLMASVRS